MPTIAKALRLLLCLSLIFALLGCSRADESGKGTSREPEKGETQRTIISLSPSITETLYAFGGAERVLGVDRFSDQVPAAKADLDSEAIALFGDAFNPAREAIKAAAPSHILVEGDSRAESLRSIGEKVEAIKSENLDEIFAMWARVGEILDAQDQASKAQRSIQKLLAAIGFERAPRVLITYSTPDQEPLFCVGKSSYQSEILNKLGGVNILSTLEIAPVTPQLSLEKVIEANPDIIITILAGTPKLSAQERWSKLDSITAVKTKAVYDLTGSAMTFYGPDSLATFTKALRDALLAWQRR